MEQFVMLQSKKVDQLCEVLERCEKKLVETTPPESEWLNSSQVCFMLTISKRCLANYVSQRILKSSKLNGLLYFKRKDILELLEKNYR
jgi:hypothetical protein